MRILVTGGLGAIGSWVVRILVERGLGPIVFDSRPDTSLIAVPPSCGDKALRRYNVPLEVVGLYDRPCAR